MKVIPRTTRMTSRARSNAVIRYLPLNTTSAEESIAFTRFFLLFIRRLRFVTTVASACRELILRGYSLQHAVEDGLQRRTRLQLRQFARNVDVRHRGMAFGLALQDDPMPQQR